MHYSMVLMECLNLFINNLFLSTMERFYSIIVFVTWLFGIIYLVIWLTGRYPVRNCLVNQYLVFNFSSEIRGSIYQ